jgi:GntR family transcriptional regulator
MVESILTGEYAEGDELPSVRSLSTKLGAYHATIRKAYDDLAADGVISKRTGQPAVVAAGARERLNSLERDRFFANELPSFQARMKLLGLDWDDLRERAELHDYIDDLFAD